MSQQTFAEMLFSSTVSETAITNTTTETLALPSYTFPANYFYQGRTIRFTAHGIVSNVVTAAPTMTFKVRLGTAAALTATVMATTAAIAANATANTNLQWRGEWTLVCRTSGTGGTCMTTGMIWLPTTGTSGLASGSSLPASAPATAAVDTTVANNLGALVFTWGTANASNSIQVIQYELESLT